MKIGLGLLVLVLVGLIIFNPGPEKFEDALENELQKEFSGMGEEFAGEAGRAIGEFLGMQAAPIAGAAFNRDNYYAFSIYSLDLNGAEDGGTYKFLGIANTFLPLEQPDFD